MLLKRSFASQELNSTLENFLLMLSELFGQQLVSLVLHGSIVFDDLAPGYGDLDFVAVIDTDISETQEGRLVELRKCLRGSDSCIFARMLEGAFLPRHMLDPANTGRAVWWGTTGERPWNSNELGWSVLRVIREFGRVIFGQDIRQDIPVVSRQDILKELKRFPATAVGHAADGGLHSIDWLLTAARLLLWIKDDQLSSKSDAADWGHLHAHGSWRELLPKAKYLRLNPIKAVSTEWSKWLDTLEAPIKESAEEVDFELSRLLGGG